MTFFVKTLTGRKREVVVEPTDTILSIKKALERLEGIDKHQIRLILNGKQLQNTETLADSKIANGTTIHMVLSLRGC